MMLEMPESFRVVEDWPPQTVPVLRQDRPRLSRRSRRIAFLAVLAVVLGGGLGLFVSGLGSALVGVRHLDYGNSFGSSGHIDTYGKPEVHVFGPGRPYPPSIHFDLLNTSRWTVTVTKVEVPLADLIGWRVFIGPPNTAREQAEPFRSFTLKPSEDMDIFFMDGSVRCAPQGAGITSTAVTDGVRVTYRIAGVTRVAHIPGHRFVFVQTDRC